jgi:hypothetical protein
MRTLLFVAALALAALPAPAARAAPDLLALTHVAIIDATGAAPRPDATVVITGNRITALGPAGP